MHGQFSDFRGPSWNYLETRTEILLPYCAPGKLLTLPFVYTRRLCDIPITNATLALISDLPRLFEELYSKAAIKLKHKFQVAEFGNQAKIDQKCKGSEGGSYGSRDVIKN